MRTLLLILVLACSCHAQMIMGVTGGAAPPPAAATPTFDPAAGSYYPGQSVTISSTTSGATICYTTDDSDPTATTPGTCANGTTYSTPVSVAASDTLKAIATKTAMTNSAVATAAYVIYPNLLTSPNDLTNGAWTLSNATVSDATTIVMGIGNANTTQRDIVVSAGTNYTASLTFTPTSASGNLKLTIYGTSWGVLGTTSYSAAQNVPHTLTVTVGTGANTTLHVALENAVYTEAAVTYTVTGATLHL